MNIRVSMEIGAKISSMHYKFVIFNLLVYSYMPDVRPMNNGWFHTETETNDVKSLGDSRG